ncbi:hypothetical protein MBLNU13_g06889t1 [Cladosporium sp. NU13]
MKFSSFLIFTAAGLAIAAPIDPINTEKKLTIEPVAVAKRQTSLDPIVDAAHGKLPVPVKRQELPLPDSSGLLAPVDGGVPNLPTKRQLGGLLPSGSSKEDGSETAEEPKIPKEPKEPSSVTDGKTEIDDGTAESSTSSAASALGGLPIGKRQLGGLIPSGSSTDDGSETAEEPKIPKEPKEPSSVSDGKTEIDDGTAESSTSSATSALGGLPIGKRAAPSVSSLGALTGAVPGGLPVGKRQLGGITDMLSPKPAEPEAAPADEAAPSDAPSDDPKEAEEPQKGETAATEGDAAAPAEEDAAPPAEKSALGDILKRQLGGLTKGLIPSSTPEDAKDAEGDAETEDAAAPEEETKAADKTAGEETAPAEDKTAEETAAPAKNATEPAPAKEEKTGGLLGSLGI